MPSPSSTPKAFKKRELTPDPDPHKTTTTTRAKSPPSKPQTLADAKKPLKISTGSASPTRTRVSSSSSVTPGPARKESSSSSISARFRPSSMRSTRSLPSSVNKSKGTTTDSRLDDPRDVLERVGDNLRERENRRSVRIEGMFASVAESISSAQDALDQALEDPATEATKSIIHDLLAPAQDVAALLDLVSEIHPAIGAVNAIFKVVVRMELDHHENHSRIAILHFSMTDMLFSLGYLDPVFSKEDGLSSILDALLKKIEATITSFGNFCDVYYKHKSFVRFLRSASYKEKLSGFASSFSLHKEELNNLLSQRTVHTVTDLSSSMQSVHAKLDDVLRFIEVQRSKREVEVGEEVVRCGGGDEVIKDATKIEAIANKFGEELSANVMFTLYTSIDHLMEGNLALFALKVETASAEIKEAIDRSTKVILLKLDSGPHDLIENEEIRNVWKEMHWRISCKCRHFVDALHHHYFQQFSRHRVLTGESHPHQWTLFFLSNVLFYPAIGEALDEDGSGFISVYEVNKFLNSLPDGWSTPQWLAFWAAGWYQNAITYSTRCSELADEIVALWKKTLPENRKSLKSFMRKPNQGISDLRLVFQSVAVDTLDYFGVSSRHEFAELQKLRADYMKRETAAMVEQIQRTNYQLDSIAAVHAVLKSRRVEVSVLCLIHLLLRRYKQIVKLAQTKLLDPQEFQVMFQSGYNLTEAFERRFNNLQESWRQQRLDVKLQVTSSAGGIFNYWYLQFYQDDYDSDSDSEFEGDTSIIPEIHDEPTNPEDILVFGLPVQAGIRRRDSIGTILTSPTTDGSTSDDDLAMDDDDDEHEEYNPRMKESTAKRLNGLEDRLVNIEKLLLLAVGSLGPSTGSKGGHYRGNHSDK